MHNKCFSFAGDYVVDGGMASKLNIWVLIFIADNTETNKYIHIQVDAKATWHSVFTMLPVVSHDFYATQCRSIFWLTFVYEVPNLCSTLCHCSFIIRMLVLANIIQYVTQNHTALSTLQHLRYKTFFIALCSNTQKTVLIWRCMHRASSYNMYINQQDAQNSCD